MKIDIEDLKACCKRLQAEIDALWVKINSWVFIDYQPQIDELRKLILNINVTMYDDSDLQNKLNCLRKKLRLAVKKLNGKLAKLNCLVQKNDEKLKHQSSASPEISLKIKSKSGQEEHSASSSSHHSAAKAKKHHKRHENSESCDKDSDSGHSDSHSASSESSKNDSEDCSDEHKKRRPNKIHG
jgi:hypothetical protein